MTDTDKLTELEREIAMRRYVYPGQVRLGLLNEATAARRIAILEAIADDYRARVSPSLFEGAI
jgi:hypothetical protein